MSFTGVIKSESAASNMLKRLAEYLFDNWRSYAPRKVGRISGSVHIVSDATSSFIRRFHWSICSAYPLSYIWHINDADSLNSRHLLYVFFTLSEPPFPKRKQNIIILPGMAASAAITCPLEFSSACISPLHSSSYVCTQYFCIKGLSR